MKNFIALTLFLFLSVFAYAKTRIYFNGSFDKVIRNTFINPNLSKSIKPNYYQLSLKNNSIKENRIKSKNEIDFLSNGDLIINDNIEKFISSNKINLIVFLGGVPDQYKNKNNYVDFENIRTNLNLSLRDKNSMIINNQNLGKLENNWNSFIQKASNSGNISGLITFSSFKSVMKVKIRTNTRIYSEGYDWNKSYYSNQKYNINIRNLQYGTDDYWITIEVTDSSGYVFIKEYTDLPKIETKHLSELNFYYYSLTRDVLKPVRHFSTLYYGIPVVHTTSLVNKYVVIKIIGQNRIITNRIDNNNLVICDNNKNQVILINPIPDNDSWCNIDWGIVEISVQDQQSPINQPNKSSSLTLKAWQYDPDANYPTVEEAFCYE